MRRPRLRPGLYEEAAAAVVGRVASGWSCSGDMALLREDAQSKVRTAARVAAEVGCGGAVALGAGLALWGVRELPALSLPLEALGW